MPGAASQSALGCVSTEANDQASCSLGRTVLQRGCLCLLPNKPQSWAMTRDVDVQSRREHERGVHEGLREKR